LANLCHSVRRSTLASITAAYHCLRPCPQVLLCDGRGQAGRQRQLTRFKDRAYSGCYRADGQLLVAGGESGLVQVGALDNSSIRCHVKLPRRGIVWLQHVW